MPHENATEPPVPPSVDAPDPAAAVGRRRLLPAPERARSIRRAAARAFARGGYAGTSIERVAAEAGVSKLIVYRHFDSKADLYRAVLDEVRDRLAGVDAPRAAVLSGDPVAAVDAVAGVFRQHLRVAREDPDGFRLLHRDAPHEPEFAGYVRLAREANLARAAGMLTVRDPRMWRWLMRSIAAAVDEAIVAWLDDGDEARDGEMAYRLALLLASMGGSPAAAEHAGPG